MCWSKGREVMATTQLPERDADGQLPSCVWPGGYPLYYFNSRGETFCPPCATKVASAEYEDPLAGIEINWEDASLYCDECSERIESAYAEPEDEE